MLLIRRVLGLTQRGIELGLLANHIELLVKRLKTSPGAVAVTHLPHFGKQVDHLAGQVVERASRLRLGAEVMLRMP